MESAECGAGNDLGDHSEDTEQGEFLRRLCSVNVFSFLGLFPFRVFSVFRGLTSGWESESLPLSCD